MLVCSPGAGAGVGKEMTSFLRPFPEIFRRPLPRMAIFVQRVIYLHGVQVEVSSGKQDDDVGRLAEAIGSPRAPYYTQFNRPDS